MFFFCINLIINFYFRFQAIECYLANVKPNLSTDVENWDQQAVSKFEELTQGKYSYFYFIFQELSILIVAEIVLSKSIGNKDLNEN